MTGVPSFDIQSKPPPAPTPLPQKSLYGNPAEMDVLLEAARTSIASGCIILEGLSTGSAAREEMFEGAARRREGERH